VGHGKGKRGQLLEADEGAEAHRPKGVVIHRALHDPLSKPVLILDLTVKVTSERALPRSDQPPIFSPLRVPVGHVFALSLNKHKRLTTSRARNSTTDGAAPPVSSSSNRSRQQQRHTQQFAVHHCIVISLKSSTRFRRRLLAFSSRISFTRNRGASRPALCSTRCRPSKSLGRPSSRPVRQRAARSPPQRNAAAHPACGLVRTNRAPWHSLPEIKR
jgi:hypothetical protein